MMVLSRMKSDPFMRAILCLLLLSTATFLAFAPDAWLVMMARAFMWQWTMLFAAGAFLVLFKRTRVIGLCAAACMLMSASQLAPIAPAENDRNDGSQLRILHMNVLQPNERHDGVIAQALSANADLIAVQEVDGAWAEALSAGLEAYPYRVVEPRSNCYGIALFSRLPLIDAQVIELHGTPLIEASVMIGKERVGFVTAHATSPISHHHFRKRNDQLKALAARLDPRKPTIVAGDFNSVHWDDAFERFCDRSGLRPVSRPGLRTWPAIGPIALIPIDHFFLSPGLNCTELRRIELPGSDHFGLVADIGIGHEG